MSRIYLSGPITKDPLYETKFNTAREKLEAMGYDVVNPAELTKVIGSSFTYDEIMMIDLDILHKCDALVQLPGWEESRGANIEYGFALGSDKLIIELEAILEGGEDGCKKN
ncbi:DUF4406 domain-containing protein [Gemmiger sp.]